MFLYHLSMLILLRGYPLVKWQEGFTKLKAPWVAYYLHTSPAESILSLAIWRCHFFKHLERNQ